MRELIAEFLICILMGMFLLGGIIVVYKFTIMVLIPMLKLIPRDVALFFEGSLFLGALLFAIIKTVERNSSD